MPGNWDNKALPHNCLIISLIFIENKCFSGGIWNLKREKKNFANMRIRTQVALYAKVYAAHILASASRTDIKRLSFVILTIQIRNIQLPLKCDITIYTVKYSATEW